MEVRILKTDGGPHAADEWAAATAGMLVDVDPNKLSGARLIEAQKIQAAVAEALIDHHSNVQAHERDGLQEKGDARHSDPLGVPQHVEATIATLRKLGDQHPALKAHLAAPGVELAVRNLLDNHYQTSQQVERNWHKSGKGV